MNARKYKRSCTGSSTIETALIISAILLVLAALIYSFLIMYQKLMLTKTAEYIAQQGAVIWTDSKKSIYNGAAGGKNNEMGISELYYQLLNDSLISGKKLKEKIELPLLKPDDETFGRYSTQDEKFYKIRRALYKEISRGILKPSAAYLEVDFSNILIQRKINITVTQEVKVPFGLIKRLFNGKESLVISGHGAAVVTETDEYIRNIDFAMEYISRAGTVSKLGEKINALKAKLEGESK